MISSRLKFVVLVAGFKSSLDSHKQFYHAETRVNIPSMHVVGESDKVISAGKTEFVNNSHKTIYNHRNY